MKRRFRSKRTCRIRRSGRWSAGWSGWLLRHWEVLAGLALFGVLAGSRGSARGRRTPPGLADDLASVFGSGVWLLPVLLVALGLARNSGMYFTRRRKFRLRLVLAGLLVPVGYAYVARWMPEAGISGGKVGEVYVSYWTKAAGTAMGQVIGLGLWLAAAAYLAGQRPRSKTARTGTQDRKAISNHNRPASLESPIFRFIARVLQPALYLLVTGISRIGHRLFGGADGAKPCPAGGAVLSCEVASTVMERRTAKGTPPPAGGPSDWIHLPESAPPPPPVFSATPPSPADSPTVEDSGATGTLLWPDEPLPASILDRTPPETPVPLEIPDLATMADILIRSVEAATGIRLEPIPEGCGVGLHFLYLSFRRTGGTRMVRCLQGMADDVGLLFGRSPVRLVIGEVIRWEMPLKPAEKRELRFAELLEMERALPPTAEPSYLLGSTAAGHPLRVPLRQACHMLVAGATGSGKTVGLHGIIFSLVFRYPPSEVRLAFGDHKVFEFEPYRELPHRWGTPASDRESFDRLVRELEDELRARKEARRLDRRAKFPALVCVIDEFQGFDTPRLVNLLAEARALDMFFILATQHPLAEVLTSQIKANLVTRVAFRTRDSAGSHLILGTPEAASLAGAGDCIVSHARGIDRVQMPWISAAEHEDDSDIGRLAAFLAKPPSAPVVADEPAG